MHLSILIQMASGADPDRVVVSDAGGDLTAGELHERAVAAAALIGSDADRVVFLGQNSRAVPITLFAAALCDAAFTPLNYRLVDADLQRIAGRAAPAVAVVDDDMVSRISDVEGLRLIPTSELLAAPTAAEPETIGDPDETAVLLFTSGTTGEPKAAVLHHSHVMSYVMGTLEFASADPEETGLVSVPPYHIAGITAIISSLFTGRRIAYLQSFTPDGWVDAVDTHRVTHAMVVPTMLGRVLDVIAERGGGLTTLRHLSYGGGRMPIDVIERALGDLPSVDFVNAYGLTETSSTIAVLAPDDHRAAIASDDPAVRGRLGSVGKPSPAVEVSIRDEDGNEVPPGDSGEIWVRGEQVSGEYVGRDSDQDEGWFHTNDGGHFDEDGFLYVEGRLDDVIVRGGENISPGEIEDVLRTHPLVADVAVFGIPSTEWGEAVAAVIVPADESVDEDELRTFVRERLRSTKVPEVVEVRDELPYSETGKLLRRVLKTEVAESRSF